MSYWGGQLYWAFPFSKGSILWYLKTYLQRPAEVAPLVEHWTTDPDVEGSNPTTVGKFRQDRVTHLSKSSLMQSQILILARNNLRYILEQTTVWKFSLSVRVPCFDT